MMLAIFGLVVLAIVLVGGGRLLWLESRERGEGRDAIDRLGNSLKETDELLAEIQERLSRPERAATGLESRTVDSPETTSALKSFMKSCREFESEDWVKVLSDYPGHRYRWLEAILRFESPNVASTDTGSLIDRSPSAKLMMHRVMRGRVA